MHALDCPSKNLACLSGKQSQELEWTVAPSRQGRVCVGFHRETRCARLNGDNLTVRAVVEGGVRLVGVSQTREDCGCTLSNCCDTGRTMAAVPTLVEAKFDFEASNRTELKLTKGTKYRVVNKVDDNW